jgi:hypothetical protein
LLKVGVVALDGTKMKANAALDANRTHEGLAEEVKRMLAEAEAVDKQEDALYGEDKRGDELPEGLRDRKGRLARLKECKERLEQEASARAAEQAVKIAERQAEEEATGKKKRGRKPKDPDATVGDAKANVTDPDSRIMKTRKGYEQAYNAQAGTTEDQIIVVAEVTTDENDAKQYHPMMRKAAANLQAVGVKEKIGAGLADAGYWSKATVVACDPDGPESFIATTKDWKQRKAMRDRAAPRGRIPKDLDVRALMERRLLTKRGRELYKKRSQTIEPVFGQVKEGRGADRFMRRGLSAVDSEWKVICATHNLLKLFRSGKAKWN